jgi:hypothetical protein
MEHIPLIAVIHDGIHNSVCESQVIEPLKKRLLEYPGRKGYLITFEKHTHSKEAKSKALKAIGYAPITVITASRTPFITRYTLKPMVFKLHTLLQAFDCYELIARGPIAGYLALNAASPKACLKLTVQARGLLGHEYRYTHEQAPWYMHAWHAWRARQFDALEKTVYGTCHTSYPYTIESVSVALSDHLIHCYCADSSRIIQAHIDIPHTLSLQERMRMRAQIRAQLGLDEHAYIMCYSGSIKAWQCPQETITLFAQTYTHNTNARLVILTLDVEAFAQLIQAHRTIPSHAYRIVQVTPAELINYLSACDAGIVLRSPHIVNWVSRPTKALEYRAAGLDIIHNNTIGMLCCPLFDATLHKKSHPHVDGSL